MIADHPDTQAFRILLVDHTPLCAERRDYMQDAGPNVEVQPLSFEHPAEVVGGWKSN